ncbi:glutathione S-transferase family protein [Noviherbaspirillum sedimenti]|uniref:Glutathione S-transferase family protein n=1 Tax=Noviherbaspirillum sedimenti TaxID=2320865 RepID=A0A3A3G1T8_9BURK|nr:glutathione S-transferase family protein [Noviherbaspirillum sedimenti]RJG01844.1 glutathione S-transferase family protein [Noviherbaspirillum sedimenti]
MMPALRLHGYAVSNYFNIVRAALIEKNVEFEIVTVRASQQPDFLAHSPMGKIPVLETPQGWMSETVAILEYIEDTQDGPCLHPVDPYLRARGRQIINIIQMYVEAQVRTLYPGVFMDGKNSPETVEAVRRMLIRASSALGRFGAPWPFLLGKELSYADLFAYYCFDIAERVTCFEYGRSLLAETEGLKAWFALMSKRASSRVVMADFDSALGSYLIEKNAAYNLGNEKWKNYAQRNA